MKLIISRSLITVCKRSYGKVVFLRVFHSVRRGMIFFLLENTFPFIAVLFTCVLLLKPTLRCILFLFSRL